MVFLIVSYFAATFHVKLDAFMVIFLMTFRKRRIRYECLCWICKPDIAASWVIDVSYLTFTI